MCSVVLSSLVQKFAESETIKMSKLSKELRAKGIDIIDLGHGEPDFNTPDHIREAAKKAIDENWSHYAPVAGYWDLREVICDKFKRDNQLQYLPENIIVSTGAKQSLANAILALVEKGDEVIIPAPFWVTYSELVKIAGGTPVIVQTSQDTKYKITQQDLEKAITKKTKLFLFSSPCNPTGAVYSKQELFSLVQVFIKFPSVIILSDEIYEYINFVGPHQSISQFEEVHHRVVVINGLSKGFAMTGYRLGYMAAPVQIASACEKIQGQFTNGANSVTQRAAIVALSAELKPTHEMREEYFRRRNRVMELLGSIYGIRCMQPEGAFYVLPEMDHYFGKTNGTQTVQNADDLCMYLLNKAHVSTVSGRAFGLQYYSLNICKQFGKHRKSV
jgi:aspartate aminotransferase